MKKKIVIGLLVAVLVCVAGGAGFYFGYQKGTDQYDIGLQTGYQDGYQDGYDEGLAIGYEEGKEDGYIEGYRACRAGEEEPEMKPYILNVAEPLDANNFIQSGLIWMWTINFKSLIITDISDYTLTLVSFNEEKVGNEEVELIASKATKITKAVEVEIKEGRVTFERREIKFEDLQVGDIVEVYVRWQEIFNMEPEATITVWDKRELEGLEESEKLTLSISWVAGLCGEVEKINGRILSLQRGGEKSEDVFIREDAYVMLLVHSSDSRTEVSFEEIKVGDSVSVIANFTEDKKLEGMGIDISRD